MLTLLEAADLIGTLPIDPIEVNDLPDPRDSELNRKTVCPFKIIVDTREQSPFHFLNIDPFSVIPLMTDTALTTGDYSISGMEDRITIERKSISDLLGSITAGRDRFEREFERMANMEFAAVVVEGELSEICRYTAERTRLRTDSLLGTIDSWAMRYGVHWRFYPGRRFAEIATLKILYQFWKQDEKRKKEALKGGKPSLFPAIE